MQVSNINSQMSSSYRSGPNPELYLKQQSTSQVVEHENAQNTQVTLSAEAQNLARQTDNPSVQPVHEGNGQYKEAAKAIATYNMVANLADDNLSIAEAHLIKSNDTARQLYFGKDMLAHQTNMAEAYMESIHFEDQAG